MTRILVKDLEPGRLHYIQARVNNGAETSEWSPIVEFTTISDTLAPAPCTGLTWTVEGTAFKAVWTGPITNEDGTPLLDFKDFQVKVFSPAAPSTAATYYTTAARFDFPFESNLNAFGTPRANVSIEVRARDNTGNLSTMVTATATNPAPANVTGLTAVGITDAVALRWDSVADTDLKHYEVRQGTSAGSVTNLVYTGRGTSFVFDTTATVAQYFQVVAVDVFNTKSATPAAASATPKSSLAVDGTPPGAPSNVAVTSTLDPADPSGGTAYVDVSWTGVSDTDLQNYSVRYGTSGTATAASYSDAVLADTPLAYYRLNETSGTTATDSSGNARHGSYTGTYTLGSAGLLTANTDKSADFTTGRVTVPDAAWMDPTYITIECLVNLDSVSQEILVERDDQVGNQRQFQLRVNSGKLEFLFWNAAGNLGQLTSTATLAVGTTYHIAVTFDGTALRMYINGSLDKSGAFTGTTRDVAWQLSIGMSSYNDIWPTDGRIDEVAIYGSALSASRISAHYTAASTGSVSSTPNQWQYIDVPEGTTNTRINNLRPNTDYYVAVAAVDYSGNSSTYVNAGTYPIKSAKDTSLPAAPTGLTVGAGVTTITATWNANTEADVINGNGLYQVQLDTVNTFDSVNLRDKQVGGTVVSFSGLTSGTTYYVRLRAIDASANNGAWSSIVSAAPRNVENADIAVGSLSGDKITAASLNGDRVIANTLDAASIKANSTFSQNLFVGSKFTMAATGIMESDNYVAGSTGWQLKNNTLEINSGTILAKALKLQHGHNMIHPAYADFEFAKTWYTSNLITFNDGGTTSWAISDAADVPGKYSTQCIKTSWTGTGTFSRVYLGATYTTYNHVLEPNTDYIISAWVYVKPGAGSRRAALGIKLSDGSFPGPVGDTTLTDNGVWTRIWGTFNSGTQAAAEFYLSQYGSAGDVYWDGIQLEKKVTADSTPSQWKPPSTTSIDGGSIRTGEIRSTAAANGLTNQPAWSINMQGNAQFGDANVRGRLVVGDPNSPAADGVNSRIYSSNYVPGTTGWIIRSDGYAEFRNLAVNSVKVTAFDSPFQNTAYAKLFDYMQDGSLWLTDGQVVQKNDPGAFSANSLFEFTGPGLIIRNGTGVKPIAFDPTILYRVSARVRAFSVTPLNTNGDFESGMTNWTADTSGGTTGTISTTEKYAGTQSLQIASASATNGVYRAWTGVNGIKAGYTYTLNARIKANIQAAYYNASNQGNIELRVTYFSGANQSGYLAEELYLIAPPVDANGNMLTAPTAWFPVGATFTPPAGATSANFIIRLARYDTNIAAGTTIGWIDDVQITTPPRIKLGVFGTDMDGNIIDYDFVNDATTPTKKHAFPAAGSYGTLSSYTASQYMVVADNDEIATAVSADSIADWVTITGYLKGRGGSGTDGSFGNPSKAPDPYLPASVNDKVAFLLPYVEFDVASGTKAQLDQFSLEAFEGGAPGKVATSGNTSEKSVTIEKIDGETFDHAVRFFTGNADERRPAIIGQHIDNDLNDAAHLRIVPPRLTSDQSDLSSSFIGIWERNPNYIYDAAFEDGITGWSGMANTSVSWNQTDGYSDANSLAITCTTTPATPASTELLGKYTVSTLINSELIGQTVTVSGKAKMGSATGRNVRLVVKYLNETGGMISGWYIEKALTNAAWTSYAFYTPNPIPEDCYSVEFSYSWYNGAAGDVVIVDEVQLEAGGLTKFRSAQASQIALNAQVVRSSGSIIVSTDSEIEMPSGVLMSNDRRDAPSQPMILLQNEGGTTAVRGINWTDSYGNRASANFGYFSPTGVEESTLRIYGLNDERFPGQVAITSPNTEWALVTKPRDGDTTARYDTHIYGRLYVDGDLDWKPLTSTTVSQFDTNRALGYAKQNGMVYLRGAGSFSGSNGSVLFTLPSGYRPPSYYYLTANMWSGTSGVTAAVLQVQPDGDVIFYSPTTPGNNFTFDGICFPINPVPGATTPTGDTTPPGAVSGFKITALSSGSSTGTYRLTWTNPTATDLAGVKIIWRSDRYPTVTIPTSGTRTLTTDGKIVTITGSSGQAKTYDHSSLPVNKTIYYRVVAYDKSGNHSGYVSASRYLLASPVTVYADSSDSYRLGYGGMWRNDGDDVYQGDWTGNDNHRGLFFYGTKIYDAVAKGGVVRTPTKMTIYLKRKGSGGNNAGVGINLRGHKYQVKPSGDPVGSMTNEGSDGDDIVFLSLNEGATVTIPSSWYNNFVVADPNNTDRIEGIGVYGSTSSDYAILYGRSNSSSNGKVTIYHKG